MFAVLIALFFALIASPAQAAALDGTQMGYLWALPFVGILLSIATGPVLFHHFWEHHYGKIAALWASLTLIPLLYTFGWQTTASVVSHVLVHEYVSFIIVLFGLFTISGGLLIKGNLHGSPVLNTSLLALGGLMASLVGTTGASMILIRPILRANDERIHNVHVVVFFIFIVSNVGGALSPLGDPPLFVGFLKGVDFFWTTKFLFSETMFVMGALLGIFFLLDSYFYKSDAPFRASKKDPTPDSAIRIEGLINIPLLLGVVGAVLLSGFWKPNIKVDILGLSLELQNLVRDIAILFLAYLSVKLTKDQHRMGNGFTWGPILEVAKLFVAIFICIIPVLGMLAAGKAGVFAPLLDLVTKADGTNNTFAYFWLTGILSGFLDNAPTYLVFFEMAGGDPQKLMTTLSGTLMAISTGAVYMGALSYIGNAPNFMVYAIARHRGINMPSFFGYMLWSFGILVPVLLLMTFLWF